MATAAFMDSAGKLTLPDTNTFTLTAADNSTSFNTFISGATQTVTRAYLPQNVVGAGNNSVLLSDVRNVVGNPVPGGTVVCTHLTYGSPIVGQQGAVTTDGFGAATVTGLPWITSTSLVRLFMLSAPAAAFTAGWSVPGIFIQPGVGFTLASSGTPAQVVTFSWFVYLN